MKNKFDYYIVKNGLATPKNPLQGVEYEEWPYWHDFESFAKHHTILCDRMIENGQYHISETKIVWQYKHVYDNKWIIENEKKHKTFESFKDDLSVISPYFEAREFLLITPLKFKIDTLIQKYASSEYTHTANEPQFDCEMVEFQRDDLYKMIMEYNELIK